MVLYNAEIDEDKAKNLRDAGLIILKSFGENKADIKVLNEQLNQTQTQTLIDDLYQKVLEIVGMPNRNGGTSTSDTGAAVIVRDGWSTAEARAKSDEANFKRSEREFLKIALSIIKRSGGLSLMLKDVDIKFTRHNYDNIQSKWPVNPSMQAISISSTPRALMLFNTESQNFALSFSPTHIPRISFRPSILIPIAIYTAFLIICPSLLTWKCMASMNTTA